MQFLIAASRKVFCGLDQNGNKVLEIKELRQVRMQTDRVMIIFKLRESNSKHH